MTKNYCSKMIKKTDINFSCSHLKALISIHIKNSEPDVNELKSDVNAIKICFLSFTQINQVNLKFRTAKRPIFSKSSNVNSLNSTIFQEKINHIKVHVQELYESALPERSVHLNTNGLITLLFRKIFTFSFHKNI